jgi:hypothetical protein
MPTVQNYGFRFQFFHRFPFSSNERDIYQLSACREHACLRPPDRMAILLPQRGAMFKKKPVLVEQ